MRGWTGWEIAAAVTFAAGGAWLSAIDIRTMRLPRRLIYATAVIVATFYLLAVIDRSEARRLVWAVTLAAASVVVMGLLARLSRGGLGDGDVRLAGLIGLVLGYWGWSLVALGLTLGFVLGGSFATVAILSGRASLRSDIPFGPFMIAGALIALVVLRGRYGH